MVNKKWSIGIIMMALMVALFAVGCGAGDETTGAEVDIPMLKVGYIFTNHHTPLMVAAAKGEGFKEEAVYLEELIERQMYRMHSHGKPVADLELVVTKSGSESVTMMAQNHLDIGLHSITSPMTAVDKGGQMRVLCPVHTEGICLVGPKDSPVSNWDEFKENVQNSLEPVKVGYHSPTSAPLMLFEAAIKEAGLISTGNQNDLGADILLVDLKGTSNLLPAMNSNQVDFWVGPSPFPELAEVEGMGKIILDMKHLPPEGKWHQFPCCVASASEQTIENFPQILESFVELLSISADFANHNPQETAEITAHWTGVSLEAAEMALVNYTTNPDERWLDNVDLTYQVLKETDQFSGDFTEKTLDEAGKKLFDFSFINKVLKK